MELVLGTVFGVIGLLLLWVVIRSAVVSALRAHEAPPESPPTWTAGIREQPKPTP